MAFLKAKAQVSSRKQFFRFEGQKCYLVKEAGRDNTAEVLLLVRQPFYRSLLETG